LQTSVASRQHQLDQDRRSRDHAAAGALFAVWMARLPLHGRLVAQLRPLSRAPRLPDRHRGRPGRPPAGQQPRGLAAGGRAGLALEWLKGRRRWRRRRQTGLHPTICGSYRRTTPMSAAVRVEKSGPVTTVILDRPAARNAIDPAAAAALYEAFLAFESDPRADAAVLWGAGGAFCAGADLKHLAAAGDDGGGAWLESLQAPPGGAGEVPPGPLRPPPLELSKPVIAAIAGAAVAGGMELALWCDLRIMEESAYLGVYS